MRSGFVEHRPARQEDTELNIIFEFVFQICLTDKERRETQFSVFVAGRKGQDKCAEKNIPLLISIQGDNNMKIPPLSSSWWLVLVCSCQYEECIDFSQELAGKGILRTVLHKSMLYLCLDFPPSLTHWLHPPPSPATTHYFLRYLFILLFLCVCDCSIWFQNLNEDLAARRLLWFSSLIFLTKHPNSVEWGM